MITVNTTWSSKALIIRPSSTTLPWETNPLFRAKSPLWLLYGSLRPFFANIYHITKVEEDLYAKPDGV